MQGQAVCNTETGYWQIFKWCCYLLWVHKTWKAVIKEVTKAGQTKRNWLLEHGISQNHGVQSSLKHFLVQVSIWGLNSLNVIPTAHLSTLLTLFSEGSIQRNLLLINSKNVLPFNWHLPALNFLYYNVTPLINLSTFHTTFTTERCQIHAWLNCFFSRLHILTSFPHYLHGMALNASSETVPQASSSLSKSLWKCDNQKLIEFPYCCLGHRARCRSLSSWTLDTTLLEIHSSLDSKMPVSETNFSEMGKSYREAERLYQ